MRLFLIGLACGVLFAAAVDGLRWARDRWARRHETHTARAMRSANTHRGPRRRGFPQ